ADSLDDAGPLVPEDARGIAGRIGSRRGVEVGVADTAGREPDEHLSCLWLGELDLLDDEQLAELLQDCGADSHATSLSRDGSNPDPLRRRPATACRRLTRKRSWGTVGSRLRDPRAARQRACA